MDPGLPDHIWMPSSVRDTVRRLPAEVRATVLVAIFMLTGDPVPPDAKPFAELDGAYTLEVEIAGVIVATIYYVATGRDVMVQYVLPNN